MHEMLCGFPMLGNNYASVMPESEQKECEVCVNSRGASIKTMIENFFREVPKFSRI